MEDELLAELYDDSDIQRPKEEREERELKGQNYFVPSIMDKVSSEVETFMETADWSSATPRHFVALHALLHKRVYGFPPSTTSRERVVGGLLAGRMLRTQFGNDPTRMVEFVRWTWERELFRNRRATEKGEVYAYRIGLKLQFNGGLVDDWRLWMARHRKHKPGGAT